MSATRRWVTSVSIFLAGVCQALLMVLSPTWSTLWWMACVALILATFAFVATILAGGPNTTTSDDGRAAD